MPQNGQQLDQYYQQIVAHLCELLTWRCRIRAGWLWCNPGSISQAAPWNTSKKLHVFFVGWLSTINIPLSIIEGNFTERWGKVMWFSLKVWGFPEVVRCKFSFYLDNKPISRHPTIHFPTTFLLVRKYFCTWLLRWSPGANSQLPDGQEWHSWKMKMQPGGLIIVHNTTYAIPNQSPERVESYC